MFGTCLVLIRGTWVRASCQLVERREDWDLERVRWDTGASISHEWEEQNNQIKSLQSFTRKTVPQNLPLDSFGKVQ